MATTEESDALADLGATYVEPVTLTVRRSGDQYLTWGLLFAVLAGVTDTDWAHLVAAVLAGIFGAIAVYRLASDRWG